jgi:predicted Fe-Mo cluster-binding NifX family protein
MKIAVAVNDGAVSQHFGHCEVFNVYDVENNKVENLNVVPNPGHRPGFLPVFLKDNGVNVIIAGGMGGSAQQIFNENGIKVVVGASGNSDEVINQYLSDNLNLSDNGCSHDD